MAARAGGAAARVGGVAARAGEGQNFGALVLLERHVRDLWAARAGPTAARAGRTAARVAHAEKCCLLRFARRTL